MVLVQKFSCVRTTNSERLLVKVNTDPKFIGIAFQVCLTTPTSPFSDSPTYQYADFNSFDLYILHVF